MSIASERAPGFLRRLAGLSALALLALAGSAAAQESASCLSPDPNAWPQYSKPYIMFVVDTSASMSTAVGQANSCGYPDDRIGHVRCALLRTFETYSGLANFGIATLARQMSGCAVGSCYGVCTFGNLSGSDATNGCGLGSGSTRAGANIVVPVQKDDFWATPPTASNFNDLNFRVDNSCSNNFELFANGESPVNGALRDVYRYFSSSWTHPGGSPSYSSPLDTAANGERSCRPVRVIYIGDVGESCDTQADAIDAAGDLNAGFTRLGITWSVKTHVINVGGDSISADQIAAAGGTTASFAALSDTQIMNALSGVITGFLTPETCDNSDNNCNGCTDEGFRHYGNTNPGCCVWASAGQRNVCLSNFQASITPANPQGTTALLPCATPAQSQDPSTWVCYNPGDVCDNTDNNMNGSIDEGQAKCGNPLACPASEICNGKDDDCDGSIDETGCSGCVYSAEICDGCDNDCDGMADNGVGPVSCGQPSPANCAGMRSCSPQQPVPVGGCTTGGYGSCSNAPAAESCDSLDNDCDGIADDGVAPQSCEPVGTPGGLIYGGTSQCSYGSSQCSSGITFCQGWVGPSAEKCDGIDNDCDGAVDDGVSGLGEACGLSEGPCSTGLTACVSGSIVCQGGVGPQPEICDGVDNDCDGTADDAPLSGGPASGATGCWTLAGTGCTSAGLSWDAPAGATCSGNGTLASPCHHGALVCSAGAWTCSGAVEPEAEICDGIDNDCDGSIDDSAPCASGQSCQSALCRPE